MADIRSGIGFSFDGGGERGYLTLQIMKKIIQLWGIADSELWQHCNLLGGTSTGSIIAAGYAMGKTTDEMISFFENEGRWIFTIRSAADVIAGSNDASSPNNIPNILQKVGMIATNDPFYSAVATISNYGSSRLYSVLSSVFGESTMQDVKTNLIITAYRSIDGAPVLFSNMDFPIYSGQNYKIKDVVAVSAAAPIYFPSYVIDNIPYGDGGIAANNPSECVYSGLRMLKPFNGRLCLGSMGTGIGEIGLYDNDPTDEPTVAQKLMALIDTIITSSQEAVHKNLSAKASYSLDKLNYLRFQPELDKSLNTELDNSVDAILAYYRDVANSYVNANVSDIANFIGKLAA